MNLFIPLFQFAPHECPTKQNKTKLAKHKVNKTSNDGLSCNPNAQKTPIKKTPKGVKMLAGPTALSYSQRPRTFFSSPSSRP